VSAPACMTADEWDAWSAMNERLYGLGRSDSPCRDCTPLFHRDMLAGGMCDGWPGLVDNPLMPKGSAPDTRRYLANRTPRAHP